MNGDQFSEDFDATPVQRSNQPPPKLKVNESGIREGDEEEDEDEEVDRSGVTISVREEEEEE